MGDGNRHRLRLVADRTALGDIRVALGLGQPLRGLDGQDGAGQRRLAVVNVADRADVDVRFRAFKCLLGHAFYLLIPSAKADRIAATHHDYSTIKVSELLTGLGPVTSSLPRTRSTN